MPTTRSAAARDDEPSQPAGPPPPPAEQQRITRSITLRNAAQPAPPQPAGPPPPPAEQRIARSATTRSAGPSQPASVALNWIFFDKSIQKNILNRIDIPGSVFTSPASECLDHFIAALDKKYKFKADKDNVDLWKPKTLLLEDTAVANETDWIEGVRGPDFKKQFDRVKPTHSLKSSVTGFNNEDLVHLVVTVDYVTLNWIFFDQNVQKNILNRIDIPGSVFLAPASECLDHFIAALDKKYKFKADKDNVDLWKPKTKLLEDTVVDNETDWIQGVKGADFKKQFDRVKPARSLKPSVTGFNNEDEVHLVVTVDYVTLNWIFFEESVPRISLRSIDIPRSVFIAPASKYLDLFNAALDKEYGLKAEKASVEFWKPKEQLLEDNVLAKGTDWIQRVRANFDEALDRVSPTRPLETSITGWNDRNVVHLVVTADSQQTGQEQEHEEGSDELRGLPEVKRFRAMVATPGNPPSTGARSTEYAASQSKENETIYDGRYPFRKPIPTVALPIQIFHPIFERFTQLLDDPSFQPERGDLLQAQDLMHFLSSIGDKESSRNREILSHLTRVLGKQVFEIPNQDGTSPDGMLAVRVEEVHLPFFLVELKREFGEGGCDPSTQAGISMKRSWTQPEEKGRLSVLNKCCCPTFMLVSGGPWLGILGGIISDKVVVQRLTDMQWAGHSSTADDPRIYRLARMLVALRECIKNLVGYYGGLSSVKELSNEDSTHPRFYPYPTSFMEENELVNFNYVKMLETDPACVTYQAKVSDPSSRDIVVKFVARYGEDVHKFLAEENHAPKLRYFGRLPDKSQLVSHSLSSSRDTSDNARPGLSFGPMQMVVMDYVPTCEKPPKNARQKIEVVLEKLHKKGYVLGDLRRQNVLFDKDREVKIIDLDWAGRHKTAEDNDDAKNFVRYPINLNTSKSIGWSKGVEPLEPILPEHDTEMLAKMDLRT